MVPADNQFVTELKLTSAEDGEKAVEWLKQRLEEKRADGSINNLLRFFPERKQTDVSLNRNL